VCGAPEEIPTEDFLTARTAADGELPPPPCPVPEAVAQVAAGLLVAPERAGPAGRATVAGYEILGPLGRGGMGLVYQARQLQCDRVVALKMIQGGAHAQPRDLARFRTEAEAVARLQHPGIVPIYEVGEQDGWAYFALEFVPGGSLARHLAGRPQPAGPSARLVETLARTMAYAHERGILHRDLKPANILLAPAFGGGADGGARAGVSEPPPEAGANWMPKITDFGLAKRLDAEPGRSAARDRTQTGEVLGTPSYMAPEQTLGRSGEVGPAADVYALGAILYECLTGRPPFQGPTPLDTLLQVRNDEPVPPRRLVPTVPRDLATICLKCLEKEPRRRYPSAAALADDLGRFLAGQPVHARPVRGWQRTIRWARRRRTAAALVVVSAAAVLSLLTLGVWHYAELQGYNAELQGFNTELRTERNKAEQLRELAQKKEAETRRQKGETEKQWQRAEANVRRALAAVKQMLVRVSEDRKRLAHEPGMELVRRKLLEDALEFYQGFLKESPTDPLIRAETASTYLRLADVQRTLGQHADAEKTYGRAIALFQGLAAEFPKRPSYRFELAGCYTNLGALFFAAPRYQKAEGAFRRALAIQQALVAEFPRSAEYRWDLAGSQHNLATLLINTQRVEEGEEMLRQALDHRRRLAEEFPGVATYRRDLAQTYNNLGLLLFETDRPREAEQAYRQALKLQKRLVEEFPRDPTYREQLADIHNVLANALAEVGRLQEAEAEYGHALKLLTQLVKDFPKVPDYRQELARYRCNFGLALVRMKRPREAEEAFRQALDLQQRLVDEFPERPAYQSALGCTLSYLARLLASRGQLAEARKEVEKAIHHQQAALRLQPGQPEYGHRLAHHYQILAEALVRLGDHHAAAQATAEIPRQIPTGSQPDFLAVGAILAQCAALAAQDRAHSAEERQALAKAYGDRAIALLRQGFLHKRDISADKLKGDPRFAPLRPRADFQKLVKELEEAARGAPR
jgi:serine/threonine-protein kinase